MDENELERLEKMRTILNQLFVRNNQLRSCLGDLAFVRKNDEDIHILKGYLELFGVIFDW